MKKIYQFKILTIFIDTMLVALLILLTKMIIMKFIRILKSNNNKSMKKQLYLSKKIISHTLLEKNLIINLTKSKKKL